MPSATRSVEQLEHELRELIGTLEHPHLQALIARIFAPASETWERFRDAPAAKHYHHAYLHGLLEHTLTVAQAVSAMATVFGEVDRDLAVSGALLHDIGKLDTYRRVGGQTEMTDLGRLHGEIPLGYTRIRDEIAASDGFPPQTAQALLHIILSHHGALEHGSPVLPCTREAVLVHMADNLGSKLGSFNRLQDGLDLGARWSSFDKGIGTGAYFGGNAVEPECPRLAA